jgi:hypothetical protein
MAKYVLVFKGGSIPGSEEEQQRVMAAWMSWFEGLGGAVVDMGNPFGASKSVGNGGSVGGGGDATGYSILTADSLDAAIEHAKGCPILANGSVEVYEALDM